MIILGLSLFLYNGAVAIAFYSNEEKMLEEFYTNDKKQVDKNALPNKSFYMNVIENIDLFEDVREAVYKESIDVKAKETTSENNKQNDSLAESYLDKYVAVLKIPKINLEKGLFAKTSKYNDVEYNIMIHETSSDPTEDKGNVILVAHSGTANIAFFKNLYKLVEGDTAEIYYHGLKYTYKIVKTYDVEKTGTVEIDRDYDKTSLTMITCRHGTNKQIVLISELESVTSY
jgi:LPXTG-site transpeptidase (sortase) family protein